MELRSDSRSSSFSSLLLVAFLAVLSGLVSRTESAQQPFRREPGHAHWHHSAFLDVRESVRSDVRRMLHSRAEVPFQVPLEVNVVLVGMNGDGGYRYDVDPHKLEEFLKVSFSTHRPSCQETGEPLDIEHRLVYNVFPVGQPELIALEKTVKEAMMPAGTALEVDFGRLLPAYDVEATKVESAFNRLYSYIFDMDVGAGSAGTADKPIPSAIFVVNFDKVRMDPRNTEIDLDSLMFAKLPELSDADKEKQEADYIYRYRYNGGGASQVWLGSGSQKAKQPRDRDGDRKLGRERGRETSNLKFVDTETFPERLLLCPSPYPTILDVPGSPHTYWGRFLCVPETSPSPRRTRYVRRHQVGVPVQPSLQLQIS